MLLPLLLPLLLPMLRMCIFVAVIIIIVATIFDFADDSKVAVVVNPSRCCSDVGRKRPYDQRRRLASYPQALYADRCNLVFRA